MQLELNNVAVFFGQNVGLDRVSLEVPKGQIACLLGPSGCGKTTLQRAVAGFQSIDDGQIYLAGKEVNGLNKMVMPEHRKVGMVFQDFALFPHLTVEENIRFGLRKKPGSEQKSITSEMLKLIGLEKMAQRYPHQLSGGQQQRVALARAIAPAPDILLLDEPFSSLDANLRGNLAKEVRRLLKKLNITAILATHHQHEAFAIADRIGVMHSGNILQWDSPYQIYHQPSCRTVAEFIGEGCMIPAKSNSDGVLSCVLGELNNEKTWPSNRDFCVLIRPDDIRYDAEGDLRYEVIDKIFRGSENLYQLKLSEEQEVYCLAPSHVDVRVGEHLPVATDLKHLVVFES